MTAVLSRVQILAKHATRIRWLPAAGLATLLALGAFASPAAHAATASVATASVNLRAGPSTSYPVVTVVPAGAGVVTYGCTPSYAWCDIGFANYRGWVASQYITATYSGGTVVVSASTAPVVGISVVQFSKGYWDTYYTAYPWYRRWATYPAYVPPPAVAHRSASGSCAGGTCARSVSTQGVYGGSVQKDRTCGGGSCSTNRTVTGRYGQSGTMARTCTRGSGCASVRAGPQGGTVRRSFGR